jgi:hypothetical protein
MNAPRTAYVVSVAGLLLCQSAVTAAERAGAAVGNASKMNNSLFSQFGLAGRCSAKPNFEKREVGSGVALTQGGSRCAPLP